MLHDCPITCYDFLLQSSSAFLHGFHCPNAVPDVINKMALHGCSEFSSNLAKMGCPMYDPGPVPDTRPTQWVGYHTKYRGGGTVHWTHSWVREQLSRFSMSKLSFDTPCRAQTSISTWKRWGDQQFLWFPAEFRSCFLARTRLKWEASKLVDTCCQSKTCQTSCFTRALVQHIDCIQLLLYHSGHTYGSSLRQNTWSQKGHVLHVHEVALDEIADASVSWLSLVHV